MRGATTPTPLTPDPEECMSRMTNASRVLGPFSVATLLMTAAPALLAQSTQVITGQAALTDYSKEKPGTMRKITVADLPAPYATQSVDNGPGVVPRPAGRDARSAGRLQGRVVRLRPEKPAADTHRAQRRPVSWWRASPTAAATA